MANGAAATTLLSADISSLAAYSVVGPSIAGTGALGAVGGGAIAPGLVVDVATGLTVDVATGTIVGGAAPGLGSAGAVGGGGALAGVGASLAATGIAAAVAAAVIGIVGTLSIAAGASKARTSFFDREDSFKYVTKAVHDDTTLRALSETATRLMSFGALSRKQAGKAMFDLFNGEVSFGNIAGTTALLLANPLAPLTYLASQPPTKGTALRKHFEEFIENDEIGSGFFGRDSGTFIRGIGQDGKVGDRADRLTPEQLTSVGGGTRGIIAETGLEFVPAMREFIKLQEEAIGLNKEQIDGAFGLGVAYRAIIGKKGGNEEQRSLAIIADLLGSINVEGADAAESMEIFGNAILALGRPRQTLETMLRFFASEDNDVALQDQERAVQGVAAAFYQDLPQGVDAAAIAIAMFHKNATFTFEELDKQIRGAVAEAEAFGPALQEAFSSGLFDGDLNVEAFTKSLTTSVDNAFREQIAKLTFDSVIDGAFKGDILGPVLDTITDTEEKVKSGDLTRAEASEIQKQALRDARTAMEGLRPLMEELINAGRDLASVFTEADNSVLGLATAIVQLQAAQEQFNNALDARIFALRNDGGASAEVIRRDLPDIEREFRLTQLQNFGSQSEIVAAANSGVITESELEQYLRRVPGGPDEATTEDKLGALTRLQALAERDLEIRVAAINAETAVIVKQHQDNITRLTKEREQIQRNAQAAIDAKQTELEAVQEALATAQAWKATLDQVTDTLLQMQVGNTSPDSGIVRLQTLQSEFFAQQARFNDTSLTDEQRQEAAGKLSTLAPQILEQAQAAGIAQSSEAFRVIFEQVALALDKIKNEAGVKAVDVDALIVKQTKLQEDIKALQKGTNAKLDAIEAQLRTEQDAITAAQDAAKEKIQEVSNNTAGVLEWIQGQGNAIFEQKQDELKEKLAALGVTDISIESIQASSLTELQAIRALIEGQGSTVVNGPVKSGDGGDGGTGGGGSTGGGTDGPGGGQSSGRYGLTAVGQEKLKATIEPLGVGGLTYARLGGILGFDAKTLAKVKAEGGPIADLIATLQKLAPGATSLSALQTLVKEVRHKIEDHDYVSPVLGFANGGLVRGSTVARVGENGPELILPLSQAFRTSEVQRYFARMVADMPRLLTDFRPRQPFTPAAQGPREAPPRVNLTQAPQQPRDVAIKVEINISGLDTTNPKEVAAAIKPVIVDAMSEALKRSNKLRAEVAIIGGSGPTYR